jgi:hypothetical protein
MATGLPVAVDEIHDKRHTEILWGFLSVYSLSVPLFFPVLAQQTVNLLLLL